jgi:superfamily II DNA or RNA helicase
LFNTLAKAGLRSSLTIFDEAHNLVTKENSKLTDKNSPVLLNSDAIRYFTATAKDATAEDYSMKNLTRYGKILHKISPKRLVAAGHTLPMYVTLAKVRFKKAHIKDGKLTEEGNVHALIDMIKQHEKFCKEKQNGTVPAIILAGSGSKDIEYINDEGRNKLEKLGYKVFKMLSKDGTGKTDAALAEFRSHKGKKILLQFAMVGEGITIPDCSATIMMRSLSGIPFIQYGSRPCGLEDTEIKHKKYGHVVVMATDGLEGSMLSSEIQDSIENLNADEYDPFVETLMISEESTGEYSPEGSEGLYVDESGSSVDNVDGVSYLDMMIALSKIDKSESISIQEKMLSMGI